MCDADKATWKRGGYMYVHSVSNSRGGRKGEGGGGGGREAER